VKRLGLKRETVSTQVIPRDRHAALLNVFALIGGMLERISVEFRGLARSEVGEVREGFARGQKGSSAMPHKRNPIGFENLSGAARLLRSYAQAAQENIPLWHERDISHSSVERVILPDAFLLLDYSLDRMVRLVEDLEVDEAAVRRNLDEAGEKTYSGHLLLALVRSGVSREDAYRWVQEVALSQGDGKGFADRAGAHRQISTFLTSTQVRKVCSLNHQLRHVRAIFREAKREK
jgi:adenylosuccinate lyase